MIKHLNPGQTSISQEELVGLLPEGVSTLADLDRAEKRKKIRAQVQYSSVEVEPAQTIAEEFMKRVHQAMFHQVWQWAGQFHRTDKNMGVPWPQIPLAYRQLRDDTLYWIAHEVFPPDEIVIRYKHRLVSIHPFPNGNGRHSRLMGGVSKCIESG